MDRYAVARERRETAEVEAVGVAELDGGGTCNSRRRGVPGCDPSRRGGDASVLPDDVAVLQSRVADNTFATRKALLTAEITDLQQVQSNLITELGKFAPTGDPDFDDAWRSGIQSQFASMVARQRSKKALLADLVREEQASGPADLGCWTGCLRGRRPGTSPSRELHRSTVPGQTGPG